MSVRYTLGHPLVDAVIDDDRLGVLELRLFRRLWGELDFQEYSEKKGDVMAVELRCDRSNVSRALRNLVHFGYIEEGPPSAKGIGTFRLPRAVPSGVRHLPTSAGAPRIRRQVRDSL